MQRAGRIPDRQNSRCKGPGAAVSWLMCEDREEARWMEKDPWGGK